MHIAQAVRTIVPLGLAAALFGAGCGGDDFTLSSPDVANGGSIQKAQVFTGCDGGNVSPTLNWSNPPEGTQSFTVTIYDADAPTGSGFWHWAVYNIPASARSLPSNAGNVSSNAAPAGSIQGYTDFGSKGYGGPCPPPGDSPHHYTFTVYAEKVADLGIPQGTTAPPGALVSFAAKANAIASASFIATYGISGAPTSHPAVPTFPGFTLSSLKIPNGSTIQSEQVFSALGCTGSNVSPDLTWTNPAGLQAKSFVLQVYDPDAPTGSGFWHWSVFDIPASKTSIAPRDGNSGGGLPGGGTQAVNDYGGTGYGGPCPPAGATPHNYQFTVYALDTASLAAAGVSSASTGAFVGFNMRPHAIAQASFKATYGH
jgi:Raf kinase inhibitor-like YbhB/YbcL family protein